MHYSQTVKTVASWLALAGLLTWGGPAFGFMVLRSMDVRPMSATPDWIDTVVGGVLVIAMAMPFLWIRLRIYRKRAEAAQLHNAADEALPRS